MEGACIWHKEHTHRLGTGWNQAGRVRVMSLGWDSGCLVSVGYGQGERGHGGELELWLKSGHGSGQEEAESLGKWGNTVWVVVERTGQMEMG